MIYLFHTNTCIFWLKDVGNVRHQVNAHIDDRITTNILTESQNCGWKTGNKISLKIVNAPHHPRRKVRLKKFALLVRRAAKRKWISWWRVCEIAARIANIKPFWMRNADSVTYPLTKLIFPASTSKPAASVFSRH